MSTSRLSLGGLGRVARVGWPTPGYAALVYSLVLVWGLGDVVSTLFAAGAAGAGMETNPWIRALLARDPLLVLALKATVVLLAGVVLLECRAVVERVPGWRAWFVGVLTAGSLVTLNNLLVGLAAVA